MTTTRKVAALYVDPRGYYPTLAGVDCWDRDRDARRYDGPFPVVAHPPCATWGLMRHLATASSDRGCARRAVEQVRAFGGVLEQPAYSKLWESFELPRPGSRQLERDGFSVEIEQVSWGHCARKRTWLYFVGVDPRLVCQTLRTGGKPTHWIGGGHSATRPIPSGMRAASAAQRNRTPPHFAEWLVMLARTARRRRK